MSKRISNSGTSMRFGRWREGILLELAWYVSARVRVKDTHSDLGASAVRDPDEALGEGNRTTAGRHAPPCIADSGFHEIRGGSGQHKRMSRSGQASSTCTQGPADQVEATTNPIHRVLGSGRSATSHRQGIYVTSVDQWSKQAMSPRGIWAIGMHSSGLATLGRNLGRRRWAARVRRVGIRCHYRDSACTGCQVLGQFSNVRFWQFLNVRFWEAAVRHTGPRNARPRQTLACW